MSLSLPYMAKEALPLFGHWGGGGGGVHTSTKWRLSAGSSPSFSLFCSPPREEGRLGSRYDITHEATLKSQHLFFFNPKTSLQGELTVSCAASSVSIETRQQCEVRVFVLERTMTDERDLSPHNPPDRARDGQGYKLSILAELYVCEIIASDGRGGLWFAMQRLLNGPNVSRAKHLQMQGLSITALHYSHCHQSTLPAHVSTITGYNYFNLISDSPVCFEKWVIKQKTNVQV